MDNTPTALFTSHELDLTHLLQGVHQTLDAAQDQETEARKKALRRVEVELDGADDVVCPLYTSLLALFGFSSVGPRIQRLTNGL